MNIRGKAIGFSLIFTLIPLALLGTAAFVQTGHILRQKLAASTENIIGQVAGRVSFVVEDIQDLSLFLIQEPQLRALLAQETVDVSVVNTPIAGVENALRALVHSKEYIHSIYVARPDGVAINPQNTPPQISPEVTALALSRPGAPIWFVDSVRDYAFAETPVLSMVRIVRDVNNIMTHLGTIRINVAGPELSAILEAALESDRDTFAMTLGEESIAMVGAGSVGTPDTEATRSFSESMFSVTTTVKLPESSLSLVYRRSNEEWIAESQQVLATMGLVMLASLIIYSIVATVFLRRLITPIRELRETMSRLQRGDFAARLPGGRTDEIGLLLSDFNTMASRLGELVDRVYVSELHLRDAELRALQTQINPHFLYNTLDVLYWASRLESAPQTGAMIKALSRLFRYSLGTGEATTTVGEELDHLESYLTIQRSVHEENVQFTLTISPEVRALRTVRLVLQPIVENAIHHGIEASGGRGTVAIHAAVVSGSLEFAVSDSGPGFTTLDLSELLKGERHGERSIGLRNVQNRVRLVFGDEYGITLENRSGGGATVRVRQPVTEKVGAAT